MFISAMIPRASVMPYVSTSGRDHDLRITGSDGPNRARCRVVTGVTLFKIKKTVNTGMEISTPRTKVSSAAALKYRETNIAAISDRLTRETDALAAETNVTKLVADLKLIQQIQWIVCALALFGQAFGIRIHEFCSRGYQPTEVHSKFWLNPFPGVPFVLTPDTM